MPVPLTLHRKYIDRKIRDKLAEISIASIRKVQRQWKTRLLRVKGDGMRIEHLLVFQSFHLCFIGIFFFFEEKIAALEYADHYNFRTHP